MWRVARIQRSAGVTPLAPLRSGLAGRRRSSKRQVSSSLSRCSTAASSCGGYVLAVLALLVLAPGSGWAQEPETPKPAPEVETVEPTVPEQAPEVEAEKPATPPDKGGRVAIVQIVGSLDAAHVALVKRALKEIKASPPDLVLFEIDTPGGRIDYMLEIGEDMMDLGVFGRPFDQQSSNGG